MLTGWRAGSAPGWARKRSARPSANARVTLRRFKLQYTGCSSSRRNGRMNQRSFQRWRWRLSGLKTRRGIRCSGMDSNASISVAVATRDGFVQRARRRDGCDCPGFLAGHCLIHSLPRLPALAWLAVVVLAVRDVARRVIPRSAQGGRLSASLRHCWRLRSVCGPGRHAARRLAGLDRRRRRRTGPDGCGLIASLPDSSVDPQFVFDVVDGDRRCSRASATDLVSARHRRHDPASNGSSPVRLKRLGWVRRIRGGFDYEGHLFREGIGAVGYA